MHPLAWWAWALGLAVATTRSTSTVVTGLVLLTTVLVVLTCRTDTPWGRAFGGYLALAAAVVLLRVVFHVVVGIKGPGRVLLDLPPITLPSWAVGVELFGPVALPGLLLALAGGLRLAALILCFGAANTLANPKRALRTLPSSLHQLGTAVVIAVSTAPQLVASAGGVRRAQRLRGIDGRGPRVLLSTAVPVLADALDRSQSLAASMDVRGYARTLPGSTDRRVGFLLTGAVLAAALGSYGLLDGATPSWMGVPVLLLGSVAAVAGTVLAGRRVRRSRYRADPWRLRETVVGLSGGLATVALLAAEGAARAGALLLLGAGLAVLPAFLVRHPWGVTA